MSGHIFINQPAFSARIMKSLLNCRSMTRFDWFELISNKTRTATLESLHFLSFSLCLSLSLIHYFFLFFLFFLFSLFFLFFLFFLFIPFSLCLSLCLSVSLSLSLSLSLFSPLFPSFSLVFLSFYLFFFLKRRYLMNLWNLMDENEWIHIQVAGRALLRVKVGNPYSPLALPLWMATWRELFQHSIRRRNKSTSIRSAPFRKLQRKSRMDSKRSYFKAATRIESSSFDTLLAALQTTKPEITDNKQIGYFRRWGELFGSSRFVIVSFVSSVKCYPSYLDSADSRRSLTPNDFMESIQPKFKLSPFRQVSPFSLILNISSPPPSNSSIIWFYRLHSINPTQIQVITISSSFSFLPHP